jgi:hypothetical protein
LKRKQLKFLFTTHALELAVAAVVVGARAADTGVGPQDASFALSLISPPPQPVVLWQRFDSAFGNKANGIFSDALQPLNVVRWNVDLRGRDFSDNFRSRASNRAAGAFTRSIEYSAREAIVELPFMVWLDEHESWFADLLRGSVGNVNEEIATPLDVSHASIQEARWRSEASRGTQYGIRPLRMSPYAYVSQGFSDGEQTIFLAHVRYYYDRFADHRVELGFSVPLEYGMTLDLGHSYQFGSHDQQQRLAVKLIKDLKGGSGVAHVGFEIRQHPALIAGVTFGW